MATDVGPHNVDETSAPKGTDPPGICDPANLYLDTHVENHYGTKAPLRTVVNKLNAPAGMVFEVLHRSSCSEDDDME